MKMSVREARANFATALEAAEKGELVTITKNGKPIAELGPPRARKGFDWDNAERIRKELGLQDIMTPKSAEQWLEEFNDPRWTREIFGADYFDDEPGRA